MRRTKEQLAQEMIKYRVYQENNRWYGLRICPECKKEILHEAKESYLILRNIRNTEKINSLCDSCCRKGVKNPFFSKIHSEKSKKQNSNSRTGKACGLENAMANPIHRKSVSNSLKEKYKNGELDYLKKIQSDNAIKNQANGKLKTAPISKAEKEIKNILEAKGFNVTSQFNIGSLKYDLFILEKNALIEYNGDYWHCNPKKYKETDYNFKKNMSAKEIWERDEKKAVLAKEKGYKLFIIWEMDFILNKEKEINKILNQL